VQDGAQQLEIASEGFPDVVVWNPGSVKGAALVDLEPGGYRSMLCIEAAVIGQPVTLEPGGKWEGSQRIYAQ
jgi:glucose-6-phosphate 1-epimerase